MEASRKSHQTTIRFTAALWAQLEVAAAGLDGSVAQFVRDAARARLDGPPVARASAQEPAIAARERSAEAAQRSLDEAESSAALWEQGRLARERARILREESRTRQRLRH
jgi:hypothetical protein